MKKIELLLEISELLAKKMSGEVSNDEEQQIQDWLKQSENNQLLYDSIINATGISERNKIIEELDTQKAWTGYKKRIVSAKKRRISYNILKYAAAILLPIIAATTFFIVRNASEVVEQQVAHEKIEIEPGSRNAILVLNNGQNINLGGQKVLELKEQDGTEIVKDYENLNYKKGQKTSLPSKIIKNTIIVPHGGEYNLTLSDGTKIYINSMSKLEFPVQFLGNTRDVELQGEACFFVEKDPKHPFIVNVNGMKVEVLGTTFNVNAYNDNNQIVTTLVEGKVKVNFAEKNKESIVLAPSEQATYDTQNKQVDVRKVDVNCYVQWINGLYTFRNVTLDEIMKTLSRWYDFNVVFESPELKEITFEGGLNKYEEIEPILDIIKETNKVNITVKGKDILFTKK